MKPRPTGKVDIFRRPPPGRIARYRAQEAMTSTDVALGVAELDEPEEYPGCVGWWCCMDPDDVQFTVDFCSRWL